MNKLLTANLRRLWLNKAFWQTMILMICLEVIVCLCLLGQDSVPMDSVLFISLQAIGILTSVFFSSFLGTEYSDGTIRNKLIVGHERRSIYLASFFTGIIAVTIIYLAGFLTGGIFGSIAFASANHNIGQIAIAGAVGWFACVSYIAIFNTVGMLSVSKSRTAIICVLTAFLLMFVGLVASMLVMQGFLTGTIKTICQFLVEFNPFGQTMQTISIDMSEQWKFIAYAIILSSFFTGLGLYVFQKKDLK